MSYCRIGDHSDVYVFHNGNDYVCCGCCINEPDSAKFVLAEDYRCKTRQGMVEHLMEHEDRGHKVPQYAIDDLMDGVEH